MTKEQAFAIIVQLVQQMTGEPDFATTEHDIAIKVLSNAFEPCGDGCISYDLRGVDEYKQKPATLPKKRLVGPESIASGILQTAQVRAISDLRASIENSRQFQDYINPVPVDGRRLGFTEVVDNGFDSVEAEGEKDAY
jgi:hypothetical protein